MKANHSKKMSEVKLQKPLMEDLQCLMNMKD